MSILRSSSPQETERFAETLAKKVVGRRTSKAGGEKATVVALHGDLGAGKTTFTRGFLRALGVRGRVTSPTFILFRRYAIRGRRFCNVYHVDAYRLKKTKDLLDLGFKKILADPKNIVLIEWPENVRGIFSKDTIRLDFLHGRKEGERQILVKRRA